MTVVLLHSPFLGPASLQPLAAALGDGAVVPDLRTTGTPVHAGLLGALRDGLADTESPLVLVGHSGSGPLLPGFAAAVDRDVAALVFLDAGLPTPGRSWADTAPPELSAELLASARDDRLPPWSSWFDPDPLTSLVPDPQLRERVAVEQPEVPAVFLSEPRPGAMWDGPAGYLLLSPPYAADADRAAVQGWPVRRLDTHHLAAATEPDLVSAVLRDLVAATLAG